MSYFEDQYEAWMLNDCKGNIEDYDSEMQALVFEGEANRQEQEENRKRNEAIKRDMKMAKEHYERLSGAVQWGDGDRERYKRYFDQRARKGARDVSQ